MEEAVFRDISNLGDVEPSEPYGKPPDSADLYKSPDSKRAGSPPKCDHHPDPSYTDAARIVKFKGDLLMKVGISKEGQVTDPEIIRGLPFGLNKQALATVRVWQCRPATVDDQPVATTVPVEVSFRLY